MTHCSISCQLASISCEASNITKQQLCLYKGEANFIKTLVHFDKDNISDRVLKKIGQYCRMSDFQPDIIGKVSLAAKSLCMWVRAMEVLLSTEHLAMGSIGRPAHVSPMTLPPRAGLRADLQGGGAQADATQRRQVAAG